MKLISKNLIYAFLIFLLLSAFFALLTSPLETVKEIGLSELVQEINKGTVEKITVKGNDLEIALKDGAKLSAQKENEAGLSESLKNYGVDSEKLAATDIIVKQPSGFLFWLGALLPFILPFALIALFFWFMFRQAKAGTMQAFTFGRSGARVFAPGEEKVTFKDVAGLKEAKEELKEIVDFLKSPKKFLDIGAKIPRGVLLMGAPGTGKTLLARATAGEASVPFFHISGSEFVEMFVGVGASRVRDLFQTAKKNAPAIVFIDEIDAVGRQRGAGLGGGHDEREQTLNQILVEMDGFDRDTNIIVMAATNRPDVLDPALLRPGRFDRRVVLDEPDINDREEILKIHAADKPLEKGINLRRIAERTPGFSGADLANLVNEAAIMAARLGRKVIVLDDLFTSIEKVLLGPERKSHILSLKEKEITAYHEAGHALVAASLPDSDPVHKISIVARGRAAGYTLKLPVEDRRLYSRSKFLADMAVALGGYVSEKIVFDELTTGASDDLQRGSDLARRLVTQYGMSEKLGPITFGDRQELIFLGREIAQEKNYSEEVAAQIDKEVARFIGNAFKTAEKIITEKREKLNLIAKTLIEKETIEREEFEQIMGIK